MQLRYRVDSKGCRYCYIVKPRQFGFTTDAVIDMFDDACFVPGSSAAITAHDRESVSKIFQIAKRAYENMPPELRPVTQYDTRNEYKFLTRFDGIPLDNEFYVALKIRGTTIQRLHVSEAAHVEDRDELKMGAKQAVPKTGRITEETTGNGMNEFYDDVMYALDRQQKGLSGEMDYRVFFYPWFSNPEYTLYGTLGSIDAAKYEDENKLRSQYGLTDGQLLWRRWKLDEFRTNRTDGVTLNVFQRFKQEYPATILEAFQSGAGNVFNLEAVTDISAPVPLTIDQVYALIDSDTNQNQTVKDGMKYLYDQGFRCWDIPRYGKKYVLGCDPAGDEGQDNAAIALWDGSTVAIEGKIEKIGEFWQKIRPDLLGELCVAIAKVYNKAFIGIENNMLTTIITVVNSGYDHYYSYVEIDKRTEKTTRKIGWNTNTKTRDVMIDEFIKQFEEGSLEIRSTVTKSEMQTFIRNDVAKREHAKGKHDDMLFADFVALQMRKYNGPIARVFAKNPF